MRTQCILVSLFIGGALLCLSSDARASTVRSREACGVVRTVDSNDQVLMVQFDQKKELLWVKWTCQTQFLRNWGFDSVGALRPGTRARVYYRSPFFGEPYVTKVVWEEGKK